MGSIVVSSLIALDSIKEENLLGIVWSKGTESDPTTTQPNTLDNGRTYVV